jgi:hypothetical protein
MSSGHRGEDAASSSAVIRAIQREPGLRYFLGREPSIVSRKYLVPYGAGRSFDGMMTYVDEGVPLRFKMGVEPDKYVSGHEGFEWWLMTRKGLPYWGGPGPRSAHWWATGFEHYLMRLDGVSDEEIEAYESEWLTYVSTDEAQRISPDTVPPDLFTGAYEGGQDTDPSEQADDAKILPILVAARARLLAVRVPELIA